MKVVILAGGMGTRISEESQIRPKPLIEIGQRPILWHIMKHYAHYGFNEFVILLGYKGYAIKEYFSNYYLHQNDVVFDFRDQNSREYIGQNAEPWKVTLLDTGEHSMTGGRLKRAQKFLQDAPFMLTYGDGVSNVDLNDLASFHRKHGRSATLTAVQPLGRFGALAIDEKDKITSFCEKPRGDDAWVNGGFFIFEPEIFEYLTDDSTVLEKSPLEVLAQKHGLMAYKHTGFWQCMDTLRDKIFLEDLWTKGQAPWVSWNKHESV